MRKPAVATSSRMKSFLLGSAHLKPTAFPAYARLALNITVTCVSLSRSSRVTDSASKHNGQQRPTVRWAARAQSRAKVPEPYLRAISASSGSTRRPHALHLTISLTRVAAALPSVIGGPGRDFKANSGGAQPAASAETRTTKTGKFTPGRFRSGVSFQGGRCGGRQSRDGCLSPADRRPKCQALAQGKDRLNAFVSHRLRVLQVRCGRPSRGLSGRPDPR